MSLQTSEWGVVLIQVIMRVLPGNNKKTGLEPWNFSIKQKAVQSLQTLQLLTEQTVANEPSKNALTNGTGSGLCLTALLTVHGTFILLPEPTEYCSNINRFLDHKHILTNSVAQEPEGSSPHSQQPATGPRPEPVESNPHTRSQSP
jgi:hypothetical protein